MRQCFCERSSFPLGNANVFNSLSKKPAPLLLVSSIFLQLQSPLLGHAAHCCWAALRRQSHTFESSRVRHFRDLVRYRGRLLANSTFGRRKLRVRT